MEKNLYDRVAAFYDRMALAVLGKSYQKSKGAFLNEILPGSTVLYIGGGSGVNLPVISEKAGVTGKVFFVEASEKMLERAKKQKRIEKCGNLVFLHQTEFSKLPEVVFDVVVTQYFLDVLSDPQINGLFKEMERRSHAHSKWLLVDFFDLPERRWLQFLMISFFRMVTRHPRKDLPDYGRFFSRFNWLKKKEQHFKRGWIKAEVFQKK
ncbi:hypothetical protein GCM10028791_01220 [Echinicola sediminis]